MTSYTNAVRCTASEHNGDGEDLLDAVENTTNWPSLRIAVENRVYDIETVDAVLKSLDAYGLYYVDEQPEYRA